MLVNQCVAKIGADFSMPNIELSWSSYLVVSRSVDQLLPARRSHVEVCGDLAAEWSHSHGRLLQSRCVISMCHFMICHISLVKHRIPGIVIGAIYGHFNMEWLVIFVMTCWLYLQTHRMAPNLTTLWNLWSCCLKHRAAARSWIQWFIPSRESQTWTRCMTTSKRQRLEREWKGRRSPEVREVLALHSELRCWTNLDWCERMWFHVNGYGVCIWVSSTFLAVLPILLQWLCHIVAVFLCQVFIPAIYKNSTDIQLAESISPLDP